MAIKKRTAREADIEAFGVAADAPPPAAPVAASRPSRTAEWPADLGRTMLLRWSDPQLPRELIEVAQIEERSQQATAHRALRLGLAQLREQNRP